MKWQMKRVAILGLWIGLFALSACSQAPTKIYGSVERERILLTATQSEIVTHIFVHEGESVKVGQALVQLNDTDARYHLAAAQAQLQAQLAVLSKLRNGARSEDVAAARAKLVSAESNLAFQQKNYARIRTLASEGVQSRAAQDQAQSQYDAAVAAVRDAKEQLSKLTNGSRPEDILQASAQVDAAQANVDIAQRDVDQLKVQATRAGSVEALPWNVGERVNAGAAVVVLTSDAAPIVRAYIPEPLRARLHKGSSVQVYVDGQPKPLTATVSKIASQPTFTPYYALDRTERARLMYFAEIRLPSAAQTLPAGLPVEIAYHE